MPALNPSQADRMIIVYLCIYDSLQVVIFMQLSLACMAVRERMKILSRSFEYMSFIGFYFLFFQSKFFIKFQKQHNSTSHRLFVIRSKARWAWFRDISLKTYNFTWKSDILDSRNQQSFYISNDLHINDLSLQKCPQILLHFPRFDIEKSSFGYGIPCIFRVSICLGLFIHPINAATSLTNEVFYIIS